jgi:predicted amidohydrolase YtcJ
MIATRREFLAQVAASLTSLRSQKPDLILYNGRIVTVDDAQPFAQAVAIARQRFSAVGSNEEVRALSGPSTRLIDLAGQTVVPGFIDAHSHPAVSGRLHLRNVDADLRSIAAIQKALRERAAATPPGQWVLAFKYDDTKTAEGRLLTREDLDAVSREHPVYVAHRGGHSAYVNSLAFERAGVTEVTGDPEGGRFVRDETTRRLTGRVLESAVDALDRVIPNTHSRDDYREGVKIISKMLARAGVTSVHDAYGDPDDLRAYQDARDAGELATRVYCHIGYFAIDRMIAAGVRTGFGDEWIRVGASRPRATGRSRSAQRVFPGRTSAGRTTTAFS